METSSNDVRAGGAFVELFTKDDPLARGLHKGKEMVEKFAGDIRKAGMTLVAMGAGILAPIAKSLQGFAEYGDTIAKMAKRTGASVSFLSEMGHVATLIGQDIGSLERSLRGLSRAMLDLKRGSVEVVESLQFLNLTEADLIGLNLEDQLLLILSRLGQLEDASIRAGIAMKIFGRAGSEIIPLAAMAAEDVESARREVYLLGRGLDEDVSQVAEEVVDWMSRLKTALMGIGDTVGEIVAEKFLNFAKSATAVLIVIRELIEKNPEFISGLIDMGKTLIIAGGLMVGLGAALLLFETAIGPIVLIAFAILGIADALGILDTGLDRTFGNFKVFGNSISALMQAITGSLVAEVKFLADSWVGVFGDIAAAIQTLVDSLRILYVHWLYLKGLFDIGEGGITWEEMIKRETQIGAEINQRWKEQYDQFKNTKRKEAEAIEEIGINLAKDAAKKDIFAGVKDRYNEILGELATWGETSGGSGAGDMPLGSLGVPKSGVVGFWGGQLASERMLGGMSESIEEEQLREQKEMRELLGQLVEQGRSGTAGIATYS